MPRRTRHRHGPGLAGGLGALLVILATLVACGARGGPGEGTGVRGASSDRRGFDRSGFSPAVDHPYVAFTTTRRAVFEGEEVSADTGAATTLRVESRVRDETATVAGVTVTVVDVSDYENGELVESTEDYYAQRSSGDVAYLGERVTDYEDGRVTGHGGQWLAGRDGARPGLFMPARLTVGARFDQERAPGVAEDHSTVVATAVTVTVPAGTFSDCIETDDLDPVSGHRESKFYCRGVGLVRETSATVSLDLVEYSAR